MDNLSHSVAGLAAGELIHRLVPEEADADRNRLRRRLLLLASWLASNFPDLDLVLTPLLPPPLGYLLHHRGHTHTLFYAVPQALLLAALLWLLWPAARRLLNTSRTARTGFVAALAVGFILHMSMDYLNSYGIHPFHPFDSRWFYGDLVFILEPVFWVAFGVTMAMTLPRLWLRILFTILLLASPLYFTFKGYLPWPSWLALAMVALLVGVAQRRSGPRRIGGLLCAIAVAAVFIGIQLGASGQARGIVTAALQQRDPESRVLDVSLTSFPSNPLCWTFASVESNEAEDSYRLRRGVVSIVPAMLPAASCPPALNEASKAAPDDAPALIDEKSGSLSMLRKLRQDDCFFDAWLRFARMPAIEGGVATDIRFASTPRGNFSSLPLAHTHQSCPGYVPQWSYPRYDLLMEGVQSFVRPQSQ